ncbi:hypothetical protein OCA10_08895 [Bacillus cereus]|nr:hypothetical protein [Bacillus cereus]
MNDKPIDELVAEKVMGWIKPPETSILKSMWVETPIGAVHPQLPKFSTNIEDAWLVVEKLRSLKEINGEKVRLMPKIIGTEKPNLWACTVNDFLNYKCLSDVMNKSAPMAICIAALKAVGEEWQ